MRAPDRRIWNNAAVVHMARWHLLRWVRFVSVYLHEIIADDDKDPHDHPWWNVSIPFGWYIERRFVTPPVDGQPLPAMVGEWCMPLVPIFRRATTAHRIVLRGDGSGNAVKVWSLFITGPRRRTWGFWTERAGAARWVTADDYREHVGAESFPLPTTDDLTRREP